MQKTIAEKAKIKLIQPQLNSADNWVGEYEDNTIIFNIRDSDFMDRVLSGNLSFKSDDFIICDIVLDSVINLEWLAIKNFEITARNITDCNDNVVVILNEENIAMKNEFLLMREDIKRSINFQRDARNKSSNNK